MLTVAKGNNDNDDDDYFVDDDYDNDDRRVHSYNVVNSVPNVNTSENRQ